MVVGPRGNASSGAPLGAPWVPGPRVGASFARSACGRSGSDTVSDTLLPARAAGAARECQTRAVGTLLGRQQGVRHRIAPASRHGRVEACSHARAAPKGAADEATSRVPDRDQLTSPTPRPSGEADVARSWRAITTHVPTARCDPRGLAPRGELNPRRAIGFASALRLRQRVSTPSARHPQRRVPRDKTVPRFPPINAHSLRDMLPSVASRERPNTRHRPVLRPGSLLRRQSRLPRSSLPHPQCPPRERARTTRVGRAAKAAALRHTPTRPTRPDENGGPHAGDHGA